MAVVSAPLQHAVMLHTALAMCTWLHFTYKLRWCTQVKEMSTEELHEQLEMRGVVHEGKTKSRLEEIYYMCFRVEAGTAEWIPEPERSTGKRKCRRRRYRLF